MSSVRPRLLVWSLVIAIGVIIAATVALVQLSDDDGIDARLTDAASVQTFPNSDLANRKVDGEPLPLVTLLDQNDVNITSADLLGGPLVVNLWFSSCAPCARELPEFATVSAEFGDAVRFVGVNPLDSIEVMERFAGERGVEYELLRDPNSELANGIGAVAYPLTLFVTSDGIIVEQTGAIEADELREKVAELILLDEAV